MVAVGFIPWVETHTIHPSRTRRWETFYIFGELIRGMNSPSTVTPSLQDENPDGNRVTLPRMLFLAY